MTDDKAYLDLAVETRNKVREFVQSIKEPVRSLRAPGLPRGRLRRENASDLRLAVAEMLGAAEWLAKLARIEAREEV